MNGPTHWTMLRMLPTLYTQLFHSFTDCVSWEGNHRHFDELKCIRLCATRKFVLQLGAVRCHIAQIEFVAGDYGHNTTLYKATHGILLRCDTIAQMRINRNGFFFFISTMLCAFN